MILTKKTRIEWANSADQNSHVGLDSIRNEKLFTMMIEDQTDGIPYIVSELITERSWVDQAAAEEYRDMILSTCQSLGITLPTIEILDIT
jgi:DNA-binding sugar fermentation-stimulating protein